MIPTLLIIGLLFACLAFSDTLLHGIDVSKAEKKKPPVKKEKKGLNTVVFNDFRIEKIQELRCFYAIRICGIDTKGQYIWIDYFYQNGEIESGKIKKGSYVFSSREQGDILIDSLVYPRIEKKLRDYFLKHPSVKKEVGKFFNV